MRLLWLTDDYLPHRGGSRIVYHNICARIVDAQLCMMTRWMDGCGGFDRTAGYRIERVRVPFLNMASAVGAAELARVVGVSEKVVFAGFIPQDEIADYYNACDVFIMLNREVDGVSWEGFGIVFIEASACGKPVIGGRAGGVTDSILDGRTGLLVDPEDLDEIVKSIDTLLGDGDLARRMGAAGMERARSGFTWTESARKTLAFSEKIAGRRITDGSASGARARD